MNTFFDDVQFFFLSFFSATTEGSGQLEGCKLARLTYWGVSKLAEQCGARLVPRSQEPYSHTQRLRV